MNAEGKPDRQRRIACRHTGRIDRPQRRPEVRLQLRQVEHAVAPEAETREVTPLRVAAVLLDERAHLVGVAMPGIPGERQRERAVACESFISRSGGGPVVAMQKTEHRVRPRTFWQRRAMPHHVPELYSGLAPI
jgi:hypothetical protein